MFALRATKRALVGICVIVSALVIAPSSWAWTWPADGAVLREFSVSADRYAGGQHRGVDIALGDARAVLAPASGQVTFAGQVPTHGLTVTIATGGGHKASLTHLGPLLVKRGAHVGEGDPIAEPGPSGDPEHHVPYVHLGVRVGDDDTYVDPLSLLPPRVATKPPPAPAAPPAPTPEVAPPPPPAAVTPPVAASPVAQQPASPTPEPTAVETPAAPAAPAAPPRTPAGSAGQGYAYEPPSSVGHSSNGSASATHAPERSEVVIGSRPPARLEGRARPGLRLRSDKRVERGAKVEAARCASARLGSDSRASARSADEQSRSQPWSSIDSQRAEPRPSRGRTGSDGARRARLARRRTRHSRRSSRSRASARGPWSSASDPKATAYDC